MRRAGAFKVTILSASSTACTGAFSTVFPGGVSTLFPVACCAVLSAACTAASVAACIAHSATPANHNAMIRRMPMRSLGDEHDPIANLSARNRMAEGSSERDLGHRLVDQPL